MREIKFRAWDTDTKKMIPPEAIARIHCKPKPFALTLIGDKGDGASFNFILSQFTGLKDKNGTEIYEGDVVAFHYEDKHKNSFYFRAGVVWDAEWASFEIGGPGRQPGEIPISDLKDYAEVIGNIYENPELAKEDKDVD